MSRNICIVTTKYLSRDKGKWLTNELADELQLSDFVTVLALSWLSTDEPSSVNIEDGIKTIRCKLPKIFYRKGFFFTVLKLLAFPVCGAFAIHKNIRKCDILICNTPCVTILILPLIFKLRYSSRNFLVLWDFFPFYLLNLDAVRNKVVFRILLWMENFVFINFDAIGVMSPANRDFLIKNYYLRKKMKVVNLPLWTELSKAPANDVSEIRRKHGLPEAGICAIYGGALTFVQELGNLIALAEKTRRLDLFYVIVGSGPAEQVLKDEVAAKQLDKMYFLPACPRTEYLKLLGSCDIGLIFLSPKLEVPSFPSKSLDYFKAQLPILAGIDDCTDFGMILEEDAKAGFFARADDSEKLSVLLTKLVNDAELRERMGVNGRAYLERYFSVQSARETIISAL